MSPQVFEFPVLRSLTLSVGMALLLGNASAMALPQSPSYSSPNPSSLPPVVVDTEPGSTGTSTTPTSTGGSSIPTAIPTANSGTRFNCEYMNGQYTVMYHPDSQPNQSFPWATPSVLGGGWSSQRRCNEISRRLESYRPDGLLELRTDVVNNYNTICVTTQSVPSCRIVLTVPPGQDPMSTRDRVFQNLTVADSGEQTTAVNTYVNGGRQNSAIDRLYNWGQSVLSGGKNRRVASNNINLRPFLDPADGGTGTRLEGGVPTRTNHRLNPDRFR